MCPTIARGDSEVARPPGCHWHIEFSHLDIGGTSCHLRSILDGYSGYVLHREIRETMLESGEVRRFRGCTRALSTYLRLRGLPGTASVGYDGRSGNVPPEPSWRDAP